MTVIVGKKRLVGGAVQAGVPGWVGERCPEIFIPPKGGGTIVPNNATHNTGGDTYAPTNVQMTVVTPNADSFGKSQGQLMTEAYRAARIASAQNRDR